MDQKNALLAHDLAIVRSVFAQVRARKIDLLTLLIAVPIFGYLARLAIAALGDEQRALVALGLGAIFGFSIYQFLTLRLSYHRNDGPLSHRALNAQTSVHYAAFVAGISVSAFIPIALAIGLLLPFEIALGIVAGALSCGAFIWLRSVLAQTGHNASQIARFRMPSLPQCAGLGALVGVAIALAPLPDGGAEAVSAILALMAAFLWGNVKAQTVKFMSLVGKEPLAIILSSLKRPLAYLAPLAATLWLGGAHTAALIAGGIAPALALLNSSRVFAYLLYPRQMADWAVSVIFAAVLMVGLSFPLAAPILAAACLIWLGAKTRGRAWMIP